MQTELLGYSDFSLHCLALNNAPKFSQFLLDPEHLMDSAKCRALAELLPKLKVSWCPVMAAVSKDGHPQACTSSARCIDLHRYGLLMHSQALASCMDMG